MKSNYKRLGDFIKQVSVKNTDLKVKTLLGLSINKVFIPSVANIIGTDMQNYKIICKGQFACSLMQVRRDKKIPISLLQDYDEAIISAAYEVFEVIDNKKLTPEYLMMWFTRPEFDRQACFLAVGGVRGSLSWEDFCEMQLPIPSIEKQKEIVNEYNTVENHIKLNEKMSQTLEDTAQTIYKHWFVDFEFPISKEYANSIGKPHLEGKPYKSSGGQMTHNTELNQEIPIGWKTGNLEEIITIHNSQRIPVSKIERDNMKKIYPYHGAASIIDFVENYIFDGLYILFGEDGTVITDFGTPVLQYVWGKFWVNNHAHVISSKSHYGIDSLYILLKNMQIGHIITGGVQSKINLSNLYKIQVIIQESQIINHLNSILYPIFIKKRKAIEVNLLIQKTLNILLTKMAREVS